ncbi:hypothetical protein [Streptomyces yerevanensis]|uniref:hypothetical protein n=1 Tax=Streptomyces yerevanensis TaxID=66378 RepID=UPI000527B2FB|nr:hypothetical protein [Streptomyces yerevanensis]
MKSLKALRVTLPVGLAALTLAVAGSMSTASAATYWVYKNAYEGNCLTASTTTGSAWSGPCNQSVGSYWDWGSQTQTDIRGRTYKRLVSRATGDCLTTDKKTTTNAVWMSPCGSGSGHQFWSGDNNNLDNLDGYSLRTSDNGDAIYSTPWGQSERWVWNGTHY